MSKPSPSLVISLVALVVALSGTAIAATAITNSRQIRNGIITSADLKNGKGVDTRDLTARARRALAGQTGPLGPGGPAGPAGPAGPQGATGSTGTVDTSAFYNKTDSDSRFVDDGEQAADSAALLGTPGEAFVRGNRGFDILNREEDGDDEVTNTMTFGRQVMGPDETSFVDLVGATEVGEIEVACADPAETTLRYVNVSPFAQDVFVDKGEAEDPTRDVVAASSDLTLGSYASADETDQLIVQVARGDNEFHHDAATFVVNVINGPGSANECRAQGQSVSQTYFNAG